jgi:hypothetical protein
METKEQLKKSITEWVKIDNEIRTLKKEETIRKNEKKRISQQLIEVMRENQIDEVDLNNGKLMYTKKNVKKPITKRVLQTILSQFYKDDIDKAQELNMFIMENREETKVESIIRKVGKQTEEVAVAHA